MKAVIEAALSLALLLPAAAWAEMADRSKPVLLEADSVRVDDAKKTAVFSRGEIVSASSTVEDDRLGEVLWRRGMISLDQLSEVQPGDILVAATTSPSWTPVFSFIGGVVVDRGASLSHAAIVGREYGIPVLMNVFVGTQKIKTGQRLRLDANMGALYILDQ